MITQVNQHFRLAHSLQFSTHNNTFLNFLTLDAIFFCTPTIAAGLQVESGLKKYTEACSNLIYLRLSFLWH